MEELREKFSFLENWSTSSRNRSLLLIILVGLALLGGGILLFQKDFYFSPTKVEVLDTQEKSGEITVEIAGAVVNPGVYKLSSESRVDDLLVASGGFSASADREGIEKYLNRAAKLIDGQKVYIRSFQDSHSEVLSAKSGGDIKIDQPVLGVGGIGLTNINTATLSELDKLPGIGPVYGQSIIDHRPYSTVEELLSKEVLKQSVYEKIKNMVSVY